MMMTAIAITLLVSAAISIWLRRVGNMKIPSIGNIVAIDTVAYWDESLQNKTEAVDWGVISLGSTKNVTLYLQSLSNVKTTLHLNSTNWNPQNISQFMTLSWNYKGAPLDAGGAIKVILTLSVSSSESFVYYLITNNVTSFNFSIVIRAAEL
jgi:hypothetical protein